jgi:hypothetical protein
MRKLWLLGCFVALVSCGGSGGSSSGGGTAPATVVVSRLSLCQVCTTNAECASGNCWPFTGGSKRCIPTGINGAGYLCPAGNYKLIEGGANLVDDLVK